MNEIQSFLELLKEVNQIAERFLYDVSAIILARVTQIWATTYLAHQMSALHQNWQLLMTKLDWTVGAIINKVPVSFITFAQSIVLHFFLVRFPPGHKERIFHLLLSHLLFFLVNRVANNYLLQTLYFWHIEW